MNCSFVFQTRKCQRNAVNRKSQWWKRNHDWGSSHWRHCQIHSSDRGSIQDGSNVLQRPPHGSFGVLWDDGLGLLMCYENRERRVKFLSLKMQHADAFCYLIRVLAEAEPELKDYRCQKGHLLIKTKSRTSSLRHRTRSCRGQNIASENRIGRMAGLRTGSLLWTGRNTRGGK